MRLARRRRNDLLGGPKELSTESRGSQACLLQTGADDLLVSTDLPSVAEVAVRDLHCHALVAELRFEAVVPRRQFQPVALSQDDDRVPRVRIELVRDIDHVTEARFLALVETFDRRVD